MLLKKEPAEMLKKSVKYKKKIKWLVRYYYMYKELILSHINT